MIFTWPAKILYLKGFTGVKTIHIVHVLFSNSMCSMLILIFYFSKLYLVNLTYTFSSILLLFLNTYAYIAHVIATSNQAKKKKINTPYFQHSRSRISIKWWWRYSLCTSSLNSSVEDMSLGCIRSWFRGTSLCSYSVKLYV